MKPKIKPPTERQYQKAEIDTAFTCAPTIYPCSDCGWPVAKGYVCGYCGSNNPSKNYDYSSI